MQTDKGVLLIKGIRCPILGRVYMDQMMVDVTGVPNISVGDEVVLFGRSGNEMLSVEEVAEKAYSFNYEFVCGIGRRVPRLYFRHGESVKSISYLTNTGE